MKRKISILILPLLLLIINTGCEEEFLERTPTDAISAADALATTSNMNLILEGLHRMMYENLIPGSTGSRNGQHYFIPAMDAIVGNMIHSAPGNGWMRSELRWITHRNPNFATPRNLWYQRYHFIASTSAIINGTQDFPLDANLAAILGQAHAYRSWAYLQLIQVYAKGYLIGNPATDPGVVLMLGSEPPYEGGPRVPVQDIYDQMIEDIDQAIVYFEQASSRSNKSQLNINVAHGIKARIALNMGDWATAASEAIAARDGFPLMNEAEWKSGFNSASLPEVIWASTVIDTESAFFQSYFYYIANTFNGSQTRGNPKLYNAAIWNQIPATDYRRDVVLPMAPNTNPGANNDQGGSAETDPNYTDQDRWEFVADSIRDAYGISSAFNLHPYMQFKFRNEAPGTIEPDDVIHMRSAEMYLIEAEAELNQGDLPAAQAALQALVGTRDSGFDASSFATADALMDEIKFQWYVEHFGEGFGYNNHIRWDEPLDLTGSGADPNYYQDGFQQERPSVNDNWLWVIPQEEIDANPFLTQADQN